MSQNLCAKSYKVRPVTLRLSLLGIFVLSAVALFANTGCEDKAIGRPCDVLTDASAKQAVFNAEALECPSRICLKPVVDTTGVSKMPTPTVMAESATGSNVARWTTELTKIKAQGVVKPLLAASPPQ